MVIFASLPEEILFETAKHLDTLDPAAVESLSLVSHALRPSCLRVLFETVYLYPDAIIPEAEDIPPPILCANRTDADHLRPYVRTLVVVGSPAHDIKGPTVAMLAKVLPKLTGLSTFRSLDSTIGIWQDLYDLIATIPVLSRLEMISSAWVECPNMVAPLSSSFKHLTYGHARSPAPEYQETMLKETRTLNTFLLIHGHRLVTLEIPAELTMFSFLKGQAWPSLRSLVVHGYPFVKAGSSSDLIHFLNVTRSLRTLKIDLARTATTPKFTVYDPLDDVTEVPSSFLHDLLSFTLFQPDPSDRILKHLPSTLRTLNLLAYPRPTQFDTKEDLAQAPISCGDMVKWLAGSSLPNLMTLKVAIAAPFDRAFVDFLVSSYPILEVLELQELRQEDVIVDAREHATILASGLAPLHSLRELILQDLSYKRTPGDTPTIAFPPAPEEIWTSPFYNVALTIGTSVRSLRKITFLGGYQCPEICRVELRESEVLTFWQDPGESGADKAADRSVRLPSL